VLDANVLIAAGPRDTLLRAAERGLYWPFWSETILAGLLARRGHADPARLAANLVAALREHFPEALVSGYDALIPIMANDPKDRHVVAAAIVAQASLIVTANLSDFPISALRPYQLEACSPDTFLSTLHDRHPAMLTQILIEQGADLRQPRTLAGVLALLEPPLPQFVAAVRRSL
jgi:predicted nucleic acid-binding protein